MKAIFVSYNMLWFSVEIMCACVPLNFPRRIVGGGGRANWNFLDFRGANLITEYNIIIIICM